MKTIPSEKARQEIQEIAAVGSNGHNSFNSYPTKKKKWPQDIEQEAFHGLAGEVVNTILPHTEADPAALLLNFLVAFSSAIGRNPHYVVSGAKNFLNLYGVIVGNTSMARKGVSWGTLKEIFKAHSTDWQTNNLVSGLSSGEGLIYRVRDPLEADLGVSDKRLLVVEAEFSRVLKAMNREGNILSVIIREAYDSGELNTLTRNSPAKATGASISIIGHITIPELLRNLKETELANGFANRFLWMVVKRSKSLPEGGNFSPSEIQRLAERLKDAVTYAQTVEEMKRDDETKEIWSKVYDDLGNDKPGMYGTIVSRGQAQVARLSCLYALLDQSAIIKIEHLNAALAFWERAEASVRYIFGMRTGDPVADDILSALESRGELDQTGINELFGRNKRADSIELALSNLKGYGLITFRKEETGGRPRQLWALSSGHGTN